MNITRTAFIVSGAFALAGAGLALTALPGAPVAAGREVEVWKSPSCGCCGGWVRHMRDAGFAVRVHEIDDVHPIKSLNGVPDALGSCHTAKVAGYVVEGHVPATDVLRLLAEKPRAKGLAVPGMPADAPGMDLRTGEPYRVILFGGPGGDTVFAQH